MLSLSLPQTAHRRINCSLRFPEYLVYSLDNTCCVIYLLFMSFPWPGCFSWEWSVIFIFHLQIHKGNFVNIFVLDWTAFQICAITQHWTSSSPSKKQRVDYIYKNTHVTRPTLRLSVLYMAEILGFPGNHPLPPRNNLQTPQSAGLASQATQRLFSLKHLEWLSHSRIFLQTTTKRKTLLIQTHYKHPMLVNESSYLLCNLYRNK